MPVPHSLMQAVKACGLSDLLGLVSEDEEAQWYTSPRKKKKKSQRHGESASRRPPDSRRADHYEFQPPSGMVERLSLETTRPPTASSASCHRLPVDLPSAKQQMAPAALKSATDGVVVKEGMLVDRRRRRNRTFTDDLAAAASAMDLFAD